MITRANVLHSWHHRWSNLRAWKRDLSPVSVTVSDVRHPARLGTCWTREQRITVYRAVDAPRFNAASELYTLLHELAHAAEIEEHHGLGWQRTHADAIREVTGIGIPSAANNYRVLVEAGREAVASWWRSSGNEFLLKMTGVAA